jgi:hypothetical protein
MISFELYKINRFTEWYHAVAILIDHTLRHFTISDLAIYDVFVNTSSVTSRVSKFSN